MATRDDVIVYWHYSPRLIVVQAPSTEITIQDLHDTLRDAEDEPANLVYPSIVTSAGKESLGGSVSVGITTTLLNARLTFEERNTVFHSGIATVGTTGNTLIDSGGNFVVNGVVVDDVVRNTTNGSFGTVHTVISATELLITPLSPVETWDSGDGYEMWHVVQCNISGGNLVAVEADGVTELDPVYPSAFTQIVRTSSSSATLQEQADIEYASFNGGVTIDATSSYTGTVFPVGTPRQPVNNVTDAVAIAIERGFNKLYFIGNYTLLSSDNVNGYDIIGDSPARTTITVQAGASTIGTDFEDCTLQGELISPSGFVNVFFNNVTGATSGVAGTITIRDCVFNQTITLSPSLVAQLDLINCVSGVAGSLTPIFNLNGADVDVLVRNYSGGMEIRGFVAGNAMSIDMNSGNVILDSSCTGGDITVRGISKITDNSAGSIVDTDGLIFPRAAQLASFEEVVHLDVANGVAGTAYPIGTKARPVNNLADAKSILSTNGLSIIDVEGPWTIGASDNIDGIKIIGESPSTAIVTLTSGCSTVNTEFINVTLTGVANGNIIVRESGIFNLSGLGSDTLGTTITDSQILEVVNPALSFKSGLSTPKDITIFNCLTSSITGTGLTINMNGSNSPLIMLNWKGHIAFDNWTGGQSGLFTSVQGHVTINNTCTNGTFNLQGTMAVTDNSTGSFTANVTEVIEPETIKKILANSSLIPAIV